MVRMMKISGTEMKRTHDCLKEMRDWLQDHEGSQERITALETALDVMDAFVCVSLGDGVCRAETMEVDEC